MISTATRGREGGKGGKGTKGTTATELIPYVCVSLQIPREGTTDSPKIRRYAGDERQLHFYSRAT